MTHDYIRLLEELISLAWPEVSSPLTGCAFTPPPVPEEDPQSWHLVACWADGSSRRRIFDFPQLPGGAARFTMMAVYTAAAAAHRELSGETP